MKERFRKAKLSTSFTSSSFFAVWWLLIRLPENSGGRIRRVPLSITFHHGSPCTYITWEINNRLVGGRRSEMYYHPIEMMIIIVIIIIIIKNNCLYLRVLKFPESCEWTVTMVMSESHSSNSWVIPSSRYREMSALDFLCMEDLYLNSGQVYVYTRTVQSNKHAARQFWRALIKIETFRDSCVFSLLLPYGETTYPQNLGQAVLNHLVHLKVFELDYFKEKDS
jgi:hypothetical protein